MLEQFSKVVLDMSKKNPFPKLKVRAMPDVKSLTATVPEAIVKQLHIRAEDSLEWAVVPDPRGEYIKVNVIRAG